MVTSSTRQPVRPKDTQLHVLGADGFFFCVGQTIETEQGKAPCSGRRDQWSQLGSIGRDGVPTLGRGAEPLTGKIRLRNSPLSFMRAVSSWPT